MLGEFISYASSSKVADHLLIVEAGAPAYRKYLLNDLQKAGYRLTLFTHVPADWANEFVKRTELVDMSDLQTTLQAAREIYSEDPINGIISWNEGATAMVNYLQHGLGLPSLSSDIRPAFRNKLMMRQNWSIFNVKNPRYQVLTDTRDLRKVTDYPVILKPVELMGSIGVFKVNKPSELLKHYELCSNADESFTIDREYHLSTIYGLGRHVLAEQYIEGDEYSIEGFVQNRSFTPFGITQKKLLNSDTFFDEVGHIFPAPISKSRKDAILDTVEAAAKGLRLDNCIFHAEVRVTADEKVYMIEMGARIGGDFIAKLVNKALDVDVADILGHIASGKKVGFKEPKEIPTIGIAFISAHEQHYHAPISKIQWDDNSKFSKYILEKSAYVDAGDSLTKPDKCGNTRLGHVIFLMPQGMKEDDAFHAACSLLKVE